MPHRYKTHFMSVYLSLSGFTPDRDKEKVGGRGGGGGREEGGERRRDGVRRETEREDSGGQVEEEVEREGDRQMEQDNNKNATKTDLYSQKQKEKKNTPKNTNSTANKVYMTTECGVTQRETENTELHKVPGHQKSGMGSHEESTQSHKARSHEKAEHEVRQSMESHTAKTEYGTIQRARNHTDTRQGYAEHGVKQTAWSYKKAEHSTTRKLHVAINSPPPPPAPGTHAMYRKQVKLTLQLARQVSHHVWLVKAGTELNQRLLVGNHNFLYKQNRHSIEQNQKRSLIHNVTML